MISFYGYLNEFALLTIIQIATKVTKDLTIIPTNNYSNTPPRFHLLTRTHEKV